MEGSKTGRQENDRRKTGDTGTLTGVSKTPVKDSGDVDHVGRVPSHPLHEVVIKKLPPFILSMSKRHKLTPEN